MLSKKTLFVPLWTVLLSNVAFAFTVPSLWVGEGTGSNLQTATNWSPVGVPGSTAQANFNSSIPGIDLAPVATGSFLIGSLNFIESASDFTFNFENSEVSFGGASVGITGSTRNPTLNITNSNQSLLSNQLTLAGTAVNDFGSPIINIVNNSVNTSYSIPSQISCSPGAFLLGNDASLDVRNIATATSDSISSIINTDQTSFASSFNIGNNGTFSLINRGTAADDVNNVNIAIVSGLFNQLTVAGAFNAGNYLSLTLENTGVTGDGSSGNTCGSIGAQSSFSSSFVVGNNITITASNSGRAGGTSQTAIGVLTTDSQIHIAGLGVSGDSFTLSLSNSGTNTSSGGGTSSIGSIAGAQAIFDSNFYTGKNGSFTLSNSGVNNGTLTSNSTIGTAVQGQLVMNSDFVANNSLTLTTTNSGVDTSIGGSGSNQVGYVGSAQMGFGGSFVSQDDLIINLSNTGSSTGSVADGQVGYVSSNQMSVGSNFTVGENLNITVSNTGSYTGSADGNYVGYVGNDQLLFSSAFYVGSNANITVSNSGSASGGSNNVVGAIQRFPFRCDGSFYAGDSFNLTITNTGISTSSGTGNSVGTLIDGYQAYFGSSFTVGNNATITISNSATYEGTDTTGFVASMQDQIIVGGAFIGGENLTLSVTNTVINPNGVTGVGNIIGQIGFQSTCSLGNGTVISATNSGDIAGQIYFTGALTVNGSVTIEAINTGTSIGPGISITNSLGGDINIILENASLVVDNSGISTPVILGALNGDASSTATCAQGFIIDTDAGVSATFAGTITSMPALVKQGLGTQTMSGTVDPTSTSTVNEGILNLTGTFIGDIDVGLAGTLMGGGIITGTVVNSGITQPTNTLTIAEFINASRGTFEVGVSSSQNYLISSTTDTVLDGGSILVSSIDGTYLFYHPYAVLVSGSPITGTFGSIASVSKLLTPLVTYSDTEVFVTLHQNTLAAASSTNEKNVASVLDSITSPTLKQSRLISQIVSLSTPSAQDSLDSISGQQYADGAFFAETVNRQFIRRMYDPVRSQVTCNSCAPACCEDLTFWSEIGGDFTAIHGTDLNGYQVTAGMQKGMCPEWTIGAAISYEGDCIDYSHDGGSQYVNNGLIGVYSLYRPANYYVMTDLAYGYAAGTMKRRIHVGSHIYEAKSHPINSELTFYGELGGDWKVSKLLIQPFAGVEVDGSWMNGISETAANGWQMKIKSKDHCDVYSRAGLHVTSCKMPKGFLLSVDLAWDYRFTSSNREVDAEFALFDGEFEVYGTHLSRSSFEYGFTLLNQISPRWDVYIETTGQVWNRATAFTALAGFGYSW